MSRRAMKKKPGQLTDEQLDEIREAFSLSDSDAFSAVVTVVTRLSVLPDASNMIDIRELKAAMASRLRTRAAEDRHRHHVGLHGLQRRRQSRSMWSSDSSCCPMHPKMCVLPLPCICFAHCRN
jgi:hypothetical protein